MSPRSASRAHVEELIRDALKRRHHDDDRLVAAGVEQNATDLPDAAGLGKRRPAELEDSHERRRPLQEWGDSDDILRDVLH